MNVSLLLTLRLTNKKCEKSRDFAQGKMKTLQTRIQGSSCVAKSSGSDLLVSIAFYLVNGNNFFLKRKAVLVAS